MKFKKGQSGNPAGRPKGSKDKATAALRERIDELLAAEFDTVVAKLNELEPRDYINAWLKLLEYGLPKLNRTEIEGNLTGGGIPYSDWTDEQIHNELERLREHA